MQGIACTASEQTKSKMTNPEATEVQSAEKGPEAGEKEMFLTVKFQKLLVSPCPPAHSQQSTEPAKTISEQSLNTIRYSSL